MTRSPRPSASFLLTLLLLCMVVNVALSEKKKKGADVKVKEKKQKLSKIVFEFLDKNKDKQLTIPEMNGQLLVLEQSANRGGEGDADAKELHGIMKALRRVGPTIFNLLDGDEDRRLDKFEMRLIDDFEDSLRQNGNGRVFVQESFEILDDNTDDELDVDEIFEATKSNFIIGELAGSLNELLPLRDYPYQLKIHIKRAMKTLWGDPLDRDTVAEGMKYFDTDGDGYIQWKEIMEFYNSFGQRFLNVASAMKSSGPVAGLFGHDSEADQKKARDFTKSLFKQHSNVQTDGLFDEF
eukprot:CAMPEP_0183707364 /NCGR_PEP_ID=MMETSP0737-20130205/3958_1 /TAXON_ID=385413 /ORGANISM="Thalassiosira miniscula, Strain CCMP1093" /LENGTH=294 /DNA_ID=CAMNT_0025935007 /DNA_START=156 /DNA_END=1040 /DNA_ORIENTATION=-